MQPTSISYLVLGVTVPKLFPVIASMAKPREYIYEEIKPIAVFSVLSKKPCNSAGYILFTKSQLQVPKCVK